MKLLIDTHIWIWNIEGDSRIAPTVRQALAEHSNECWISAATFWEIMVLSQKKRMVLEPDPATWIANALKTHSLREAPINREVAILSRTIEIGTEDPVDRFLVATALVFDLTLVTADEHLLGCRIIRTLANR